MREKPDCTADRAEKFVRFFMRGEKQDCAATCAERCKRIFMRGKKPNCAAACIEKERKCFYLNYFSIRGEKKQPFQKK